MGNTGSFSLKIIFDNLDFDEITSNMKIEPTHIFRKGVIYNKITGETQSDVWIYKVKFGEDEVPENVIRKFLDSLMLSKDYIRYISNKFTVSLRCSIASNYGQMYIDFSNKVLKDLADLNVKFEISILSFGEVEN